MNNQFIHFRVQSSYSMLESTIKIDDLINLAKQHQMSAVCLSDRGNLFASLEFSMAATKAAIQPIHGSIVNILFDNEKKNDFAEILIIAKDESGYKNLLKLVSLTFTKNDRKICNHITFEDLEKYNQGLIVLSAYADGIIGKLLLESKPEEAIQAAEILQKLLGNRFYFEIQRHKLPNEQQIEQEYLNIAKKLKIPLIATNKVLFADSSMHQAHDILLCIADGVVSESDDRRTVSEQCYFKSPEEMTTLFSDLPEAIENTINLAKRCYVMSETRPPSLPNFSEGSISENDLIKKQSQDGLNKRLKQKFIQENISESNQIIIKKQYQQRLDYELSVICEMGFSGYFLIVSDFIKWSKQNNIAVGPGRGSGAGSIIAWSMEITNLDPIKFGLLFERFLNPERISMPDFDIDFCQERREEVISYVRSKYGHQRVGQIITFGKMQAKVVIKDVSRVLGLKYEAADSLTELIPFNAINPVTLSQAINDVPELRQAAKGNGLYNYNGDKELISQVLATGLKLEGLQRHASIHAAGIVIANQEITEIVPVYKDINSEMLVVQYSMKYAEAAGLVKFDFLGLQTLTVITKAIELIEKSGTTIDIESIPYDDAKTYKMLSEGLSTGVFQFESIGMKNALKNLEPDSVDDIIALGALYRPGPMDNIPTYIACKHGKQEVDYLHPLLENTLKTTYGVIIYQEQVMEIAKILAGYSLGGADLLRKAMGKKVKAEMDAQEETFISGAMKNNVPAKQAKDIFATVAKFAGYGFNKSHASAYGIISYQTAYLKANFPTEFLVACLNLEMDNSDKINIFLQEAKKFGIQIISPDINRSQAKFSIDIIDGQKAIIFAMGAIKIVTSIFGETIVSERKQNGPFKSIIDFAERIKPKLINKRLLTNVIKAGCFDNINPNRASLILSVPQILSYCSSYHEEQNSTQFSFISVNTNSNNILLDTEKYSTEEMAYAEFEVIGLFIDKHPFDKITKSLEKIGVKTSEHIQNELSDGAHKVKLAGIITKKDSRMSPKGRFITLTISDHKGMFEVTIFDDNILKKYSSFIKVKERIIVVCDVFKDKGGIRATAIEFMDINNALSNIEHHIQLYPTRSSELNNFIDLLASKKHDSESNSKIEIFLPIESDFLAKVSLPKKFELDEQDVYTLEKNDIDK